MKPLQRLTLITLALAALIGWALLGQAQAQPTPATYLPLVQQPATPTATLAPSPTSEPSPTSGPPPTATPTATATSGPPPTFESCAIVTNPTSAPNTPLKITFIDKAAETVTLQNVGAFPINLIGWRMCSVTGGQMHPLTGEIPPGAIQTFPNTGGPIWNNSSSDPGALWDDAGQLVSYWPD